MSYHLRSMEGRQPAPLSHDEEAVPTWVSMSNVFCDQVSVDIGLESEDGNPPGVEVRFYVSVDTYGWIPVLHDPIRVEGEGHFAVGAPSVPGFPNLRASVRGRGVCSLDYRYVLRGSQS